MCCSVLQCVAVCCSVLQCVAVCCSYITYIIYTNLKALFLLCVQGGENSYDALICRSFFAKEPLITGLFCGKWPVQIWHLMGLRHPVGEGRRSWYDAFSCRSFVAKEPLITGLFCGKRPVKIRHPRSPRHPVGERRQSWYDWKKDMENICCRRKATGHRLPLKTLYV